MLNSVWSFFVSVAIIFIFVMWFWLLITVIGDLFRRKDAGGLKKVLWVILLVVTPFLGVFLYLLTQSGGMAERNQQASVHMREQLRQVVGYSQADEIEKLDRLKAAGSITEEEHGRLRAQVIG